MEKKKKNKKKKFIVIVILIAIIFGIISLINFCIPVKDISNDDIYISLSTQKTTGNNVKATITSKSNYDIFYYLDYEAGEEQYYENEEYLEDALDNLENEEKDKQNTNTIANTVDNVSNKTNTSTTNNTISNTITNNSIKNTVVSNVITNSTIPDNSITTSDNANNLTSSKIKAKNISDSKYKKIHKSEIEIENNCLVYLKYGRFGKLSSTPYVFNISNIDKTGPEIGELETSSTYTSITVTVNAIDETASELKYYFRLSDSNSYISTGYKNTYTFTELTTDESYTIFVKVVDKFGNESEAVTEATASVNQEIIEKKIYHFKVNVAANTVTVYDKDNNGKYTNAIKTFICSTGKSTPKSGKYKISDRYRWRSLFGGVYGQYAVRIYGNILFHSVPYEKMYANTLEYEEYDKLGTSASLGCVRLCVKDAKWIYDNAKVGSTVEFYSDSSNPGPLGKPSSQKISSNKANRNWDPTDPDKHNPWFGGDGAVSKITILNDDDYTTKNSTTNTKSNTISNTTSNSNTIIWNTID